MAAPQIFQDNDRPRYAKAFTAHFVIYFMFNLTLGAMRLLLIRRNSKKRAIVASLRETDASVDVGKDAGDERIEHAHAFEDLTDKENPDFRYDF